MPTRIILHGKKSDDADLRAAVGRARKAGHAVDVRVTWEEGDGMVLAEEAARLGFERLVAAGGDGTINEVLNGALRSGYTGVLGIVPLGTANDFATSAGISSDIDEALRLALGAEPVRADVGLVGDRHFLNVATGGFGAEVTTNTDPALKKILGGAAYFLTGVSRFVSLEPAVARVESGEQVWEGELLAIAIGNGRQAGGGHVLCPHASINDGLLDVSIIPYHPDSVVAEAARALLADTDDALESISIRWRVPTVKVSSAEGLTVNLDGEAQRSEQYTFEVQPGAIQLALPPSTDLIG